MSLELDTNYPDFDFDKVFLEQGLIYRGTNEHNRWIYEDLSTTKRMRNNGQATDTYEFQGYNPDTDREKAAPQVAQYLTDDFDFLFMEGDTKDYSLTPEDFLEYSRAYESTSALVREDNSSAIDYTLGTQTHEDLPEPLYDPHNTVKEPELLREPLDATEFNSFNTESRASAGETILPQYTSQDRPQLPWRAPTPAPSVSRKREREEEGNIKVVGEINEMRESKRACIPSTSSFSELAMALEVAPPALGLRSPTGSAPPIVSPNLPAAPATAFPISRPSLARQLTGRIKPTDQDDVTPCMWAGHDNTVCGAPIKRKDRWKHIKKHKENHLVSVEEDTDKVTCRWVRSLSRGLCGCKHGRGEIGRPDRGHLTLHGSECTPEEWNDHVRNSQ